MTDTPAVLTTAETAESVAYLRMIAAHMDLVTVERGSISEAITAVCDDHAALLATVARQEARIGELERACRSALIESENHYAADQAELRAALTAAPERGESS